MRAGMPASAHQGAWRPAKPAGGLEAQPVEGPETQPAEVLEAQPAEGLETNAATMAPLKEQQRSHNDPTTE